LAAWKGGNQNVPPREITVRTLFAFYDLTITQKRIILVLE